MSEHDTYENHAELVKAQADPRYAESPRYRDEVAAKLQRSISAGTLTPMGHAIGHGEGATIHTRTARYEPEALYGSGHPMPGAEPIWAEAAKVGSGFFDGPEAVARAKAAPQYDLDPSYQRAVSEKIARSIREGWINTDFTAADRAKRFSRP